MFTKNASASFMLLKIKISIIIVAISFFALSAHSFINRTIIISPSNSSTNHFQVTIQRHSTDQRDVTVTISGTKNTVGQSVHLYQHNDKITLPETPLIIGDYQLPGVTAPSNELSISKVKGDDRWNISLKIQADKVDRSYLIFPPSEDVEDGATYLVNLPAFLNNKK